MTPLLAGILIISLLLVLFVGAAVVYFMLMKSRQRQNEADFSWGDDRSERTRRMIQAQDSDYVGTSDDDDTEFRF